jgi:hypothetical protein
LTIILDHANCSVSEASEAVVNYLQPQFLAVEEPGLAVLQAPP